MLAARQLGSNCNQLGHHLQQLGGNGVSWGGHQKQIDGTARYILSGWRFLGGSSAVAGNTRAAFSNELGVRLPLAKSRANGRSLGTAGDLQGYKGGGSWDVWNNSRQTNSNGAVAGLQMGAAGRLLRAAVP